jgi:hypothetical protein
MALHRHPATHHYHASAFGLAGEITRPVVHSIPTQAATTLAGSGGHGFQRVENFSHHGLVSFRAAYVEVGGGYDPCHDIHTTFASSVIEGFNVADVVTADRIVSRLAIYAPAEEDPSRESSFDITGSHFDNLRIAGHKIDVKLATHVFHECDTYSKLQKICAGKEPNGCLAWSKLAKLKERELQELENTYHALSGISERIKLWKSGKGKNHRDPMYWCSPASHLDLKEYAGAHSELQGFGSIICIPKFGVVHLAQLMIQKDARSLTMVRVQMCSTGEGGIDGGGTMGNGAQPHPP